MYRVYNGNLLYHGCVPMEADGSFAKVNIYGQEYSGKALYDVLESYVRKAFFSKDKEEKQKGMDMIWYIWTAPNSPIYGRHKMATFERYFLAETEMHHESKNAYYKLIDKPETAEKIFLGLDADDHILRKFRALCADKQVPYEELETMKELGAACGIEIGAAVACLLKRP